MLKITDRTIISFAVLCLLSACTGRQEHMRERLQYVFACNRADTVFTQRWLPTVDSLVSYFAHHGSANDRMMAHYVAGRVHHDMGEAPQALDCYQRAAEQADTTRADCDYYTLTAVYGQMANLYHAQCLPDDELQALKAAERIAWKDKDTLAAIKAYELRIRPYHLKGEKDSMLFIMKDAREQYLHLGDTADAATAIYASISIYLDQHNLSEAKHWLEIYEKGSGNFAKDGTLIKGETFYYDKGRYLLATGRTTDARESFEHILDSSLLEARYRGLLSVYKRMGIADSIAKYAELFAAANDSGFIHVNQEKVHQISAMYDYNRQQRIAEDTTARLHKEQLEKFILVLATLLLLSATIIVVRKLRNRDKKEYVLLSAEFEDKQRMLAEATDKLRLLNYDYEKEMEKRMLEHKEQELLLKRHEEKVCEKNQEIESLKVKVIELESRLQQYSSVDMEAAFKKTSVYKFFEKHRNPKYANDLPSEKDWEKLTELFRTHFVRYYSFIAITHHLSTNQFRYCILLRLGFDGSDIGVLMNKDRNQRYNLRRFIYEELFGESVHVKMLEEKLKHYF